jgi:hypothetical protein
VTRKLSVFLCAFFAPLQPCGQSITVGFNSRGDLAYASSYDRSQGAHHDNTKATNAIYLHRMTGEGVPARLEGGKHAATRCSAMMGPSTALYRPETASTGISFVSAICSLSTPLLCRPHHLATRAEAQAAHLHVCWVRWCLAHGSCLDTRVRKSCESETGLV